MITGRTPSVPFFGAEGSFFCIASARAARAGKGNRLALRAAGFTPFSARAWRCGFVLIAGFRHSWGGA
jgi:hypothetical protein